MNPSILSQLAAAAAVALCPFSASAGESAVKAPAAEPKPAKVEPQPATVLVSVQGEVKNPSDQRLPVPATIDQAFAKAGGWTIIGEFDSPPKYCKLIQGSGDNRKTTEIKILIDPKTKILKVVDEKWKDYHLRDGDRLVLPRIIF